MHHLIGALIPLDGCKRPINPETGELKNDWQLQDGYDIDGISALNGQVHAVGLMLGEKSGGVLQVDFDGPASPAKFQEIYGKPPKDLSCTTGVTSGKKSRGSRFFLVDPDWWNSLRGLKSWKDTDGEICLELRWSGHQAVIAGKHPDTRGYSWMANSSPADLKMAMAPDRLLEPLIRIEWRSETKAMKSTSPGGANTFFNRNHFEKCYLTKYISIALGLMQFIKNPGMPCLDENVTQISP